MCNLMIYLVDEAKLLKCHSWIFTLYNDVKGKVRFEEKKMSDRMA